MRLLIFLLLPASLLCQEVRPPVVTYSKLKVSDSWEIRNMSETAPLTVAALTPKTFAIDASGNPVFADIDPAKIDLKLSEHGFYLAPGQTHKTWVDIRCLNGPCWVCIFASIVQGRTSKGALVTVMLPHTVEMGSGTIHRKDVQVNFTSPTTFEIINQGLGFDRPQVEITAGGKKFLSGLPIFPDGRRILLADAPIQKVKISFAHFTLHETPQP